MRQWAFAAALSLCGLGCSTPDDLLENRPCPCIEGWRCDTSRVPSVCVPGADAGPIDATIDATLDAIGDSAPNDAADTGPLGPPPPESTRCWANRETCDWGRSGFRFDEVERGNFTSYSAGNVAFSPDACELLFSENAAGDYNVFRSLRDGPGAEFGTPLPITEVNTVDFAEDAPSVGPNGLELFVATNRDPTSTMLRRVHRFARERESDPWGATGVPIATLQIPGSTSWEPRLAPHGRSLYVALEIRGEQWVHVLERSGLGAEFGEPVRIPFAFPPGSKTNRPSVTHDGRVLVFVQQIGDDSSTRRAYYSVRPDWRAEWSVPMLVPVSIGADGMRDVGVSPDGCELVVRTPNGASEVAALLRFTAP